MTDISSIAALRDRIGQELAVSGWLEMTQDRINQFAEATGDHQWIHIDEARASKESPFKTTIAHGFLTLSLISTLARMAMTLPPLRLAINYGVNRVRFVTPVPSGARIRARFTPAAVEGAGGGIQVTWSAMIECEHSDKPSCVAEWIVRYFPQDADR
jgi:acyl dehydratase